MTATDLETIEHLDFDHQTPCDGEEDCPNKVTWRAVHVCCGVVEFYCDEHKSAYVSWLIWFETKNQRKYLRHNVCGMRYTPHTPANDIIRFYPLGE